MTSTIGAHNGLHSEQGARKGEHRGRSRNPLIKVDDIAWLEFEKTDLERAEIFAHAFGFATAARTDTDPGADHRAIEAILGRYTLTYRITGR
jgi:hypothetical protein